MTDSPQAELDAALAEHFIAIRSWADPTMSESRDLWGKVHSTLSEVEEKAVAAAPLWIHCEHHPFFEARARAERAERELAETLATSRRTFKGYQDTLTERDAAWEALRAIADGTHKVDTLLSSIYEIEAAARAALPEKAEA